MATEWPYLQKAGKFNLEEEYHSGYGPGTRCVQCSREVVEVTFEARVQDLREGIVWPFLQMLVVYLLLPMKQAQYPSVKQYRVAASWCSRI